MSLAAAFDTRYRLVDGELVCEARAEALVNE
jgi:ATP-binding cassette, subfamily B, bacterial CvaB/MchF/RaxB